MTEGYRKHMDSEMEQIKARLMRLGAEAQSSVQLAVWALARQDVQLARKVIDGDDSMDRMAAQIDESCFNFIARYQPVARDLRVISSTIHMAIDLERVADLAVNVAKAAVHIGDNLLIKPLVDIPRMGQMTAEMVEKGMNSFLTGDVELAKSVCVMDDMVDDLERQVFRELLILMIEKPKSIEQGTVLINVAANLERVGDHATNLAERSMYVCTGKLESACNFRRPL